ncbi:MAG: tetraacyldisaccharide 4'-kinase [Deferribacterales bacterium]
MGGTGKTPMVIKIGKYFIDKNLKVAVISRGYKGKIGYGLNVISDGKALLLKPPLAADEPYLIANKLPTAYVVTCKDRNLAYNYISEHYHPDIILLDDAFQHRRIKRDLDILLLDYNNPISTGFIFPFGYLREFPSAIQRGDIIVFTKVPEGDIKIPLNVKKYIRGKDIFFSRTKIVGVFLGEEMIGKDLKFFSFSGIANNRSFFLMLIKNGYNIVGNKGFRDHHSYQDRDFLELKRYLTNSKADLLITTEKDYVKLDDNIKKFTAVVRIEFEIDREEDFFELIISKIDLKNSLHFF